VRVIAGSLKGRRLDAPTWDGLRPTSDKLRETLFNVLAPVVEGARVLDLYAGTGALGIEALSRGAVHATFVERDRRAERLIAANADRCGLSGRYTITRSAVAEALASLAARGQTFDLVLMDPPYAEQADAIAAVLATAGSVLAAGGRAVFEHAKRQPAPAAAGRLVRTREVTSGDSVLSFYE
jgi:16S rRNA (guanine966-N2)-methyltransferase